MWLGLGFSESERFVWDEEMGKGSQEEVGPKLALEERVLDSREETPHPQSVASSSS